MNHLENLLKEYRAVFKVAFEQDNMGRFIQNQKKLEELAQQIKNMYPENRFNNHKKEEV
jgi:hypothetical protein